MSDLNTNLNVPPYHDDYNVAKKFYRVLFVPRRAVQTRELNQVQAIVQEQLRRFGNHIFKDGSIVEGCNIIHQPRLEYVRLKNGFNAATANVAFDSNIQGFLLVSEQSGARGVVRLAKQGYEAQYPNTNTLYVDYIKTGTVANAEVSVFQSGDTINIYDNTQGKFDISLDENKLYNTIDVFVANVAANQTSTGQTYAVTVGEGVVYQKGFFVNVSTHTITVRDYSSDVSGYLVGFNTEESIISHTADNSLIDPVDGSNQFAPGADRLRLNPVLVSKHKDSFTEADDFFPIIEFNDEKPVIQNTDPAYAALGDALAKRTFEGDGDFYTKPFIVAPKADDSNTSNLIYSVDTGIGYVKGNRIELLASLSITAPRATTTAEAQAAITTLNYGYYVIVDEATGMFDHDSLNTVSIYDAAQNAVSEIEGSSAAPTGNIVGTANIRAAVYESGYKGTAGGKYRLYLTNVTMASGKSFSTDAKSFYSSTGAFGPAKADIVLEGGKALLKDSGQSALIFDTGIQGVKRLRDSGGVNDTQFYYRDIASATLQSNGTFTFTLNTPHAGGNERFFASAGALSSVNEQRVTVAFSANAVSNALSGTVDSTTVANVLTGSGTSFTTDFQVGSKILVQANSITSYARTILAIANNISMTLDSAISHANASATHKRFWATGEHLDLQTAGGITVVSNTQFTVSAGYSFESGAPQTMYASYPVFRTQAVESKKTVEKDRFVKINCNTGGTSGPWNLGLVDVYEITSVFVGSTYVTTNPDRKSWFILDTGQADSQYNHAKLSVRPEYRSKLDANTRLLVKLNRFAADYTTGTGFFSVDSYPTRAPGVAANTTNIAFTDIPNYGGFRLRNSIDFRPQKYNTANSATSNTTATENPVAANSSFVVPVTGTYIGEPDTTFQADIEYYLPRQDLIQVNRNGQFGVKSSVPSLDPRAPVADGDSMGIAVAYVPPFPSLTQTETTTFGTTDKVTTNLVGNRNYTKKDINGLDQRITRLEYYQTLSLLEATAKDYTVKDENGLDRFKNGIFADPFNNHALADYGNFEYAIAIDEKFSIARPMIAKTPIDLKVGLMSNTAQTGQLLSLPKTAELYLQQVYASKFRNATESVWAWTGEVELYPGYDHSKDEVAQPAVNITVDLTTPWDQLAASSFGTDFGDWRVVAQDQSQSTSTASSTAGRTTSTTTTTATTTTTTLNQTVNQLQVSDKLSSYDLGEFVTDFTLNPFMRSREVAFIATGLKPNTNFWAFFDDTPVSASCANGVINGSAYNATTGTISVTSGSENQVVRRTAAYGTQLQTDANGNLFGIFLIPGSTFRVGDRVFQLANVDSLVTGSDAITSAAKATYTASSVTLQTKSVNINIIEPVISSKTTTNVAVSSATSVAQRTTTSTVPRTTATRAPFEGDRGSNGGRGSGGDPLGQSFHCDLPAGIPGVFLEKIGVYFKSKDSALGLTLFLVEMTNGVPDTSKILAKSYLKPSGISISNDASAETSFVFDNIPYLTNGSWYAFFLAPDGNNPEYNVFMAEIGGTDLQTGFKIHTNPAIGTAFVSSNATTWTALQKEDVKFNIYRCKFTSLTGTVTFVDQDDEYLTLNGFTLANSATHVQIGDVVYTQNSIGGLLTGNTDPFGVIQFVDPTSDKLILDGSTGGFTANAVLAIHRPPESGNTSVVNANTKIAQTTIITVDNVDYSLVVPRIGLVTPFGTSVSMRYKGMDSAETVDPAWIAVQAETEREFIDKMRTVKSKSNRIAVDESATFELTLTSPFDYLSPVIDLRRRSALYIRNIINNDLTNEDTRHGNSKARYLSQKVVLAEGQDAEDIKVLLTGYRPSGSEITVYCKFLNAADTDPFEERKWTKMRMTSGTGVFGSILNPEDYREYEYSVPLTEASQGEAYLNASNSNILEYRNAAGSIFIGYKTFAIKIVLTAETEEKVPRLRDVRSIALQI